MAQGKFHFSHALLPQGWARDVAVETDAAGVILKVAPGVPGAAAGVMLPGLANVHSHAHQRAMAGLAERSGPGADSFWTWREAMYGNALKMGPDDLKAIAAQLYVECLKAGFTSLGEFQYLHHQPDGSAYANRAELSLACLEAAREAEIGITLLPVLYRHGGFGGAPAGPGQRRFLNDADGFLEIVEILKSAIRGHERLGIAPHSLRAVTVELLSEVLKSHNGLVHIHVAEQMREVEDCLAFSGKRPVEYLMEAFGLGPRWSLVHATHMNARETAALAASGATAALCPITEANLGDGIFNGVEYLAQKGAIAIGTDSHVSLGAGDELRLLEYSQRYLTRARNVLAGGPERSTGRTLFDAAQKGGAASIDQPCAIAPGARLDAIVLDPNHPTLITREGDAILDSWIFSGGNPCIRHVIVAGKAVIRDGHHSQEEAIFNRFKAAMARLKEAA